VSLCFLDPSPDIAEEVTAACLDGYLTARARVGAAVFTSPGRVCYLTTKAMRNALGAAGPILGALIDPKFHPMIEQTNGVPMPA